MGRASNSLKFVLHACLLLCLVFAVAARGQEQEKDAKAKSDATAKDSRLTILVTGGDEKKPIDSASVYVRFVEEHKHGKDKKIEMNLKTNQEGICHVPVIPSGNFQVQVIAEGWKTFGEYYDPGQVGSTINVSLVRPPKWY